MRESPTGTRAVDGACCQLSMLGTFDFLVRGERVDLPRAAERLVAYLALQATPVSRYRVAAALWPDADEQRSLGCLRSALWRVRAVCRALVDPATQRLGLAHDAVVDTHRLAREVRHLSDPGAEWLGGLSPEAFGAELLPGWDDDWVLVERERYRQLSLCGLDALSRRRLAAGRVLDALEAAWQAIALEPLRESSHQALIDAHLAEGNLGEAVRGLRSFESLLDREMGIAPSPELVGRVAAAVADRSTSNRFGVISAN